VTSALLTILGVAKDKTYPPVACGLCLCYYFSLLSSLLCLRCFGEEKLCAQRLSYYG